MKFCAQCGEPLEDGDIFCPNCGSPQSSDTGSSERNANASGADTGLTQTTDSIVDLPEPTPKKKKIKIKPKAIIAIALVAAIVGGLAALILSGAYAALLPAGKLKLGLAEKKLFGEVANDPLVRDIDAKQLSFELTFDFEDFDEIDSDAADLLNKAKINFDYDAKGKGIGLTAGLKGNTLLDFRMICDGEKVGLYLSPASDDYYIANVRTVLETITGNNDLPEINLDILFEQMDTAKVKKDGNAILGILAKSLSKAEIDIEKKVDIELFGEDDLVNCVEYDIDLDDEELIEDLINDIADYLDSDSCYTKQYYDKILEAPIIEYAMKQSYGYGYSSSAITSFSDVIDQLRDYAPELAEEIVDLDLSLRVYMKGNTIVRQILCSEDGAIGYDSYKEGNTVHTMFYFLDDPDRIEDADAVIDFYTKFNGSKREIRAEAREGFDEEPEFTLTADIDTSSRSAIGTYEGTYKVELRTYSYYYGNNTIELNMDVSRSGSGMMHKIAYESGSDGSFDVNLLVSSGKSVKAPSGASKEDISDYSQRELISLAERLAQKLYTKLGNYFDF